MAPRVKRGRPVIAFFDFPDVFEDFYPHYGVDQQAFATQWMDTAVHGWLVLVQREVGDVIWYVLTLAPEMAEARHARVGCRVKFLRSSWLHRSMWRAFYLPRAAWRWRGAYRAYALLASYAALASWPFLRALRQDRPDVFFVASYSSGRFDVLLLLARVLRVPLVALHTGGTPDGYLGRFVRRFTIRRQTGSFPPGKPNSKCSSTATVFDETAFRCSAQESIPRYSDRSREPRRVARPDWIPHAATSCSWAGWTTA